MFNILILSDFIEIVTSSTSKELNELALLLTVQANPDLMMKPTPQPLQEVLGL